MGKRKMGFEPERARGDRKPPPELFVPSGDSLLARYLAKARGIERDKQNSGNPSSSAVWGIDTLRQLSCWGRCC